MITTEPQAPSTSPPKPRWRLRTALIALAVTIIGAGGTALGLMLTATLASGAASVLQRDGYTVIKTLTAPEVMSSITKSGDASAASLVSGDAAYGIRGMSMEAAVHLSGTGVIFMTAFLPVLQSDMPGDAARITPDGYLVITGPAVSFTQNLGNLGS